MVAFQKVNLGKIAILLVIAGMILFGWSTAVHANNTYKVQRGDTLWSIAQRYNTTVAELAAVNGISNPGLIYSGQNLKIPAGNFSAALASREGRVNSNRFSQQEIDLFARLVHSEAAGESYVGQVAVAASVLNRVASSRYPNTLSGVIYQVSNGYYQYSPVLDGRINLPANKTAYQAVYDAIGGWDPSNNALGFYNPRRTSNRWVRQQPVTTVIGNHVFFR